MQGPFNIYDEKYEQLIVLVVPLEVEFRLKSQEPGSMLATACQI
jgi:hypothetical protein